MKAPLLNSFERQVIRETKSFYKDRLLLHLAIERLKRDFYYLILKKVIIILKSRTNGKG